MPQMHLLALAAVLLAPPSTRLADRVVVVRNDDSPVSRAVADDYCRRRGVRAVVAVRCQDAAAKADDETITFAAYRGRIETPLRAYLAAHRGIDFIVLTKGVPIRIADAPGQGMGDRRPSLDSCLAALDYASSGGERLHLVDTGFTGTAWANRFWNAGARFSHAAFGGYLVTRLDGATQADAIALTTRSLAAERALPTGTVLLDTCPDFGSGDVRAQPLPVFRTGVIRKEVTEIGYAEYNADMRRAAEILRARSVPCVLDEQPAFVGVRTDLAGYVSWGSNDRHYDPAAYHGLRFAPGALCETAVSTSARTFLPTTGGQSLIADLVAQGATGAKGYTDEPLLIAVASPSVLFDRYTRGWTLAESFYAASRFVGWEDIVLGDPICCPYRGK